MFKIDNKFLIGLFIFVLFLGCLPFVFGADYTPAAEESNPNFDDASIASRKVVLTKDNTTQYVLESGTCTNDQAVSFTSPFASGSPSIVLSYAEDPGSPGTTNLYVESISTNGFTAKGVPTKDINWIAIGIK